MNTASGEMTSLTFFLNGERRPGSFPQIVKSGQNRLPRITEALALAIHFEHMVQSGEAKDYADVARLAGLCRERVSQIIRLIFLAPDIQVEVLSFRATFRGGCAVSEAALRKIANHLSWEVQRKAWSESKKDASSGARA